MRKALPRYATATFTAVLLVAAAAPVGAQAATQRPVAMTAGPTAVPATPTGRIVTGVGDVDGYHLFVGSAADGWAWHPLATIQPGGAEDERWIGQQCLTGDGRTVLVAVAPWSANNSTAGMGAGADVYAIDAGTGAVRPVATGASLAYFDPGCGTGAEAVLTGYSGDDQSVTRLARIDVTTGAVVGRSTIGRELTSAVPAGGRILAADGPDLVSVAATTVQVLAHFGGQLSDLRPAADGGVDLLSTAGTHTSVWHWSTAGTRHLADATTGAVHLFLGAGGHNIAVGAGPLAAGSGLRSAPAAGTRTATASLDGAVTVSDLVSATPTLSNAGVTMAGAVLGRHPLPGPAAVRAQAAPSVSVATSTARPVGPEVVTPDDTTPPETASPQCAVPRNDIFKQVWQPTAAQVRWAINQAALRALTSAYPNPSRPTNNAMYTLTDASYTALAKAYPSTDFPLSASPAIPPLVMYGILAQESNWSQASWHALPGRSGNPLISSYYGTGGTGTPPIDYNAADCGYGIAQVTSGMQVAGWPNTAPFPPAQQIRVAVDYATNVAAGELILQQKWQQLQSLGITMNNADPTKVENWYGAIWAYNSGVHLPSDGAHWGLGWANNPDNPIYPTDRGTFLHHGTVQTAGDASHPQDWPYQEKVFGWMEVPLTDATGALDYRGTYDWDTVAGHFLSTPPASTFCSTAVNDCDPTQPACLSSDLTTCWWHQLAQWVADNCASTCTTDTVTTAPNGHVYYSTPGVAEPAATPSSVTCTLPANSGGVTDGNGTVKPGVVLVDDEMITTENPTRRTPNLMGCAGTNTKLLAPTVANATFALKDDSGNAVDAASTPSSPAAIDLHQLGGGLGGHLFFTHTGPPGTDEVTGEWSASLPANPTYGTAYEVKAFIPDIAAATDHATYEVIDSSTAQARTIDQSKYSNAWASLGYYVCTNQYNNTCYMTVTLRTTAPADDPDLGADIAMDAIAFVPVPTGAYVALGDSYSSGEGVAGMFGGDATFDDGSDVPDSIDGNGDLCHRSSLAWPRLLAAAKGKTIIDLACSGSNTGDIAGEQDYFAQKSVPAYLLGVKEVGSEIQFQGDGRLHTPQQSGDCPTCELLPNPDYAGGTYYDETANELALIKALRPSLVTLTVGGNDLGFADVVQSCYLRGVVIGGLCRDNDYVINGTDLLDNRIQSLEPILEDTYRKVVTAVGGATNVYVVTYPSAVAVPPTGVISCSGLFADDLAWLVPKVAELAGVIKTAGQHAGVHVIDISTLFNGHDMCGEDGTPWATAPDINLVTVQSDSLSTRDNWFHPNAAGYQAIEQAVAPQIH